MAKLKTYVISLAHAEERRSLVRDMLSERQDLDWRFFDAATPDTPLEALEIDPARQVDRYGRILTPAEIGCFKSHYTLLANFAREEDAENEWMLVLEDDVWLDPVFDLNEVIDYCDAHAIMYIRLFAKYYKPAKIVDMLSSFRQIVRFTTDPYGAQAFLINRKGAKKLVGAISHIDIPIDDEIGRFWLHGLYPYCVFPFPAVERSVVSNLENSRAEQSKSRVSRKPELILHRINEKLRKIYANMTAPDGAAQRNPRK